MNKIDKMRELLAPLQPISLEIIDDSDKHSGHAGFMKDGSHYRMFIVSQIFDGKEMIARHRMVYAALGDMMKHDIHAMNIDARTPAETTQQQ